MSAKIQEAVISPVISHMMEPTIKNATVSLEQATVVLIRYYKIRPVNDFCVVSVKIASPIPWC